MVRFVGETFKSSCSKRAAEIQIDGERYAVLPNALLKFSTCSNSKEYVESMEAFAHQVLEAGTVPNDGYFQLIR